MAIADDDVNSVGTISLRTLIKQHLVIMDDINTQLCWFHYNNYAVICWT